MHKGDDDDDDDINNIEYNTRDYVIDGVPVIVYLHTSAVAGIPLGCRLCM